MKLLRYLTVAILVAATCLSCQKFDDSELWNLDATIAKFITPRLIAFYENVHETNTHPSEMTLMDWENTLSKMIMGFKLLSLDREKTKEEEKQQWEAIKLFSKHFFNLWI